MREGILLVDLLRAEFSRHVGVEPDLLPAETPLNDLLEAVERAPADEQDVLGIDLDVFLLRVFPAALRRHRSHGTLEDLEQGLLDPFAGHVAGDAGILRLTGDLVDLIDVDDAPLAFGDVEFARLEEPDQDVLDILADVAGFGERGGVRDRERHVEDPSQRLGQQRLADAGRAEQQDVGFVEFDLVVATGGGVDPFVMVVHGHREGSFGPLLADHILVEDILDLGGGGNVGDVVHHVPLLVLRQDLVAEGDAFVADVHRRSGNEFPDRILRLPAE